MIILICIIIIVFLVVSRFKYAAERDRLLTTLVNNPTEQNAAAYVAHVKNEPKMMLARANDPNSWAVLREKWYIINGSDKIPTELKKQILADFTSDGLYVNGKIIDNFGKKQNNRQNRQNNWKNTNNGNYSNNHSDDDFLQEEMQRQQNEWAMEEARKSVTPFDMGGYVQGDGFNPSDTMAADAQREQMNQMNDMNDMGMF